MLPNSAVILNSVYRTTTEIREICCDFQAVSNVMLVFNAAPMVRGHAKTNGACPTSAAGIVKRLTNMIWSVSIVERL